MLNYHHLRYLWVAAKAGSFTLAAKQLRLSQPALSLQIRQLEASFGRKLLARGPRGVVLTPEGRKVFIRAERIFAEGQALLDELGGGETAHPVRLGVDRSVARTIILRAASVLHASGPIVIATAAAEDLKSRLRAGSLDLALSDADLGGDMGPGFSSTLAGLLSLEFVASPSLAKSLAGFPRCKRPLPMLLRPAGKPLRAEVERYLYERGARIEVVAESDDVQLLWGLALQGLGVAALSSEVAGEDLRKGRLKSLSRAPGLREHVWVTAKDSPAGAARTLIQKLVLDIPGKP